MGADRVERAVEIHACGAGTDGPGPGGWCAVLRYGRHERELSGGEGTTTARRMALTAVVRALEELKWACAVRVHTDSTYVRDGGPSQLSPVENVDLWRRLGAELERHRVRWTAGNADTERNDPNCEWLLKGQRYAHRRGDTVHDVVPVAWGSADPGHYQPCEHCCTPAWVRRHGR